MPECEIFNMLDKVLVTGMNWELFEDFDENEAEDELDGQVSLLGHELQLGSSATQLTNKYLVEKITESSKVFPAEKMNGRVICQCSETTHSW